MKFTNTHNYPIAVSWKPQLSRELIRSSDPKSFIVYPGTTKQVSVSFWVFGQLPVSSSGNVITWTARANQQAMWLNGKEQKQSKTDDLHTDSNGEYNNVELAAPKGLLVDVFLLVIMV